MPGYQDLLAANPEAFKEHEAKVRGETVAAEKQRTDAAVAKALEDQKKAKAPAATLLELDEIVPPKMEGRDSLILELAKKQATAVEAHAAVTNKLAEQLEARDAAKGKEGEVEKGLGKEGKGAPALKLAGGRGGSNDGGAETYMGLVEAEEQRLLDKDVAPNEARAKAYTKISRERPDLLKAHNAELAAKAEARSGELRARKG